MQNGSDGVDTCGVGARKVVGAVGLLKCPLSDLSLSLLAKPSVDSPPVPSASRELSSFLQSGLQHSLYTSVADYSRSELFRYDLC